MRRGKRLLCIARDKSLLNLGRLAIEGSGVIERVFRPFELGDAVESPPLVAQKIEVVRVLGERRLADREAGLIFRQSLPMLLDVAVLIKVADLHVRVDHVAFALFVVAHGNDLFGDSGSCVVFLERVFLERVVVLRFSHTRERVADTDGGVVEQLQRFSRARI